MAALAFGTALLAAARGSGPYQTYGYAAWSDPVKAGTCSPNGTALPIPLAPKTGSTPGVLECSLQGAVRAYRFPAGIFEIGEQLLVPAYTSLTGAKAPNDMANPTASPVWEEQTLFLATRGATDYFADYCHAKDMVRTRVGFVLGSFVTVRDLSYQGVDTVRPNDNNALCGGGVFETVGCAENSCAASAVNNAGSDGVGSAHVTIDNLRLNDYYYAADKAKVGASVAGNEACGQLRRGQLRLAAKTGDSTEAGDSTEECCFCKPNGVRSSQVGIWIPQTRNAEGTHDVLFTNVVSRSTQADAVNLHGKVRNALVAGAYMENTGDDGYALWGGDDRPENVTFKDCVAVNPGVLRPRWYGNCVATYGVGSVVFDGLTCRAPTLQNPIPDPNNPSDTSRIDASMFVFYTSFGGNYPEGNSVTIKGWTFEDLEGNAYTAADGTMDTHTTGKMVWTAAQGGAVAPFYLPDRKQQVNVYATQ